jgi:hypothetical protein
MHAFITAVRERSGALTDARMSLESHLLAFAAERSRSDGSVVEMDVFRADVERSAEAAASL